MRRKRRIVLGAIAFVLLLSSIAFASQKADMGLVRVARINGVGSDGSKLRTNSIDNGVNEIIGSTISYYFTASGDLFVLGEINGVELLIYAVRYNEPANENVQVFNGTDYSNHYDVLYVSFEKEINKSVKYFDDFDCSLHNSMIKVYMRTSHTDDIVIVEIFTNQDYCIDSLRQADSITLSEIEAEREGQIEQFWYAKVFTPTELYEEIPSRTMNVHENEGTYTYVFNHLGAYYYQYFTVWRYISWPSSFSNSEDFLTTLEVRDAYTEVPGYPNEGSDTTYMRINSARIDIVIDGGDAVSQFTIDGLTHISPNASVSLQFDDEISLWGPLVLKVYYDHSNNSYDLNSEDEILSNGGDRWYRQLGAQLQSGHRLESEGHFFSVDWEVSNYSGIKTNQAFKVRFSYNMSNMLDYTHWTNGDKTLTDTVYYNTTN